MITYRLSNVLVKLDDFTAQYPELYYRCMSSSYDAAAEALSFEGSVDFFTYFNAFSAAKWKRYTVVEQVFLHLELAGDSCDVFEVHAEADAQVTTQGTTSLAAFDGSDAFEPLELELPLGENSLVSFCLKSSGTTRVKNAYYFTKVADDAVRPIGLALATTTFKKEEYIQGNIEAVKREVLASDEPIASRFHMFVVDNGRTLDAAALSSDGVTVLPNDNVGGAGGFARGMMEAMASDMGATHVLLMDDDVRVSPESFKRTFNMLALANDRYKDAFVSGAMLALEQPNKQYEDVAVVRKDGVYDRIKPDLMVDTVSDIVRNEQIDVEIENAYGAWWYCCIPLAAIEKNGLPLPLFVRCDDVEYGMRSEPTIMTMNGICVWHDGFEGRFRASVDCYQYVRNFLIMIAVDQKSSERLFMLRLARTFSVYMRSMNYESAELLLDGLEDYLKGPTFIQEASGEELMVQNGKKNEKLIPVAELDPQVMRDLEIDYSMLGGEDKRSVLTKLFEMIPHDRHMLPDVLLRNKPAAVYYSRGAYPGWKTMGRKVLVALDATGENGHVRIMDKARYRHLKKRYKALVSEHKQRKDELSKAYRDAAPYMTSREFWESYLGMSK
ncbi:MAG: glycosyltransferase [Raoultibacter sp.]